MKNRLIAMLFVLFIFVCGFVTVRNSMGYLENPGAQATSESLNCELSDSDAGFNKETFDYASNLATANFAYRNKWINGNGLFQKFIGKTGDIEKGWYRLDDGQLMYALKKQPNAVLNRYAENVYRLSQYAENHGMNFLYVELPYKAVDASIYPAGVTDYGNANADQITEFLSKQNVNVLDLRNRIQGTGKSSSELYFKTDHHWKPETAIWGAGEISQELAKIDSAWKDNVSLRDMRNYEVERYPNQFLGSIGRRVGDLYAQKDDFPIVTPKFDTQYEYRIPRKVGDVYKSGTFEDVFINRKYLSGGELDTNTYGIYCDGDHHKEVVKNRTTLNSNKILLIRDSFSCTLMPYLSLYTRQMVTIDLRIFDSRSIYSYIRKHPDIDTVIVAYNPSSISEQQYTFDKVTHE